MSGDDKPVPENHPIRKLWRNSELLQTIPGTIQLAKEGDAYAAQRLLAMYNHIGRRLLRNLDAMGPHHVANDPAFRQLMEYMFECFHQILEGDSADISLNLKTDRKGQRGRPKKNASEIEREVDIAYHVSQAMNKMTLEVAAETVAEQEGVSPGTAEAAYKKYMKPLR